MPFFCSTGFRPPRISPWLHWLFKWINRWMLSYDVTWDFDEESLAHWLSIPEGSGLLIAVKHADYTDHYAIYELACRLGKKCLFVAVPETFEICFGMGGVVASRLGAFTVVRGGTNIQASRFAVNTLAGTGQPVVIFPEGELYFLNDVVTPLKPGAAHFALEAQKLRAKSNSGAVFILPVVLKYFYRTDVTPLIQKKLTKLEKKLSIKPSQVSIRDRLLTLADRLSRKLAQDYGLADELNLEKLTGEKRFLELARRLLADFDPGLSTDADLGRLSDSARKTMVRFQKDRAIFQRARTALHALDFIHGYLETLSQERMMETLRKCERLITGEETPGFPGHKTLKLRIEPPLPMERYCGAYAHPKTRQETISRVSDDLRKSLERGLSAITRGASEFSCNSSKAIEDEGPVCREAPHR